MNNNQTPTNQQAMPTVTYKTVFNEQIGQLDEEVSKLLSSGWQPAGPAYYVADKKWFVQPLVIIGKK